MRGYGWTCIALALAGLVAGHGSAASAPRITEKTEYYEISGKTGVDLFWDMNRRGPRHGLLTKAIAQTRFTHEFVGRMVHSKGVCRTTGAGFRLAITYIYPKPRERLKGDLARRWKVFHAHNIAHEKMHGKIARDMARALDRMLRTFAYRDGPICNRAEAKLGREGSRIMDRYMALQKEFDRREHRDGGPVDRSVMVLVGKG